MYPVYQEGDFIFVDDRLCLPHDVQGRDCFVDLVDDGGAFLKRVRPTSSFKGMPALVHLDSITPFTPPMHHVTAMRIRPVLSVKRR